VGEGGGGGRAVGIIFSQEAPGTLLVRNKEVPHCMLWRGGMGTLILFHRGFTDIYQRFSPTLV
jgi:hypothetical protein